MNEHILFVHEHQNLLHMFKFIVPHCLFEVCVNTRQHCEQITLYKKDLTGFKNLIGPFVLHPKRYYGNLTSLSILLKRLQWFTQTAKYNTAGLGGQYL